MVFGEDEPCQQFTALGTVTDDTVYQVQMREDFAPYPVDVSFEDGEEVEVRLLLSVLGFVENEASWGLYFRRGLFEIPEGNFQVLRDRMEPTGA